MISKEGQKRKKDLIKENNLRNFKFASPPLRNDNELINHFSEQDKIINVVTTFFKTSCPKFQ